MKLQKNTRLALYSVLEFAAEPSRHVPAAAIAEKYGVSQHHLAKVLSELARAGLVESVRGVGGGYRFSGNAKRLTLLDVIRLFEEPLTSPAAAGDAVAATPVDAALDAVLAEIDQMALATFSSITLATMLRMVGKHAEGQRDAALRP